MFAKQVDEIAFEVEIETNSRRLPHMLIKRSIDMSSVEQRRYIGVDCGAGCDFVRVNAAAYQLSVRWQRVEWGKPAAGGMGHYGLDIPRRQKTQRVVEDATEVMQMPRVGSVAAVVDDDTNGFAALRAPQTSRDARREAVRAPIPRFYLDCGPPVEPQ